MRIAVVCAVDANYLRNCAALLHSLYEKNSAHGLSVYVIHDELDPDEKAGFVAFLSRFLPSVSLLQADPEAHDGFPVSGHVTVST